MGWPEKTEQGGRAEQRGAGRAGGREGGRSLRTLAAGIGKAVGRRAKHLVAVIRLCQCPFGVIPSDGPKQLRTLGCSRILKHLSFWNGWSVVFNVPGVRTDFKSEAIRVAQCFRQRCAMPHPVGCLSFGDCGTDAPFWLVRKSS